MQKVRGSNPLTRSKIFGTLMKERTVWYLNQVDLFRGIPDQDIMKIASKVVERQCQKKELLYTPFEVTESIYVLKKGEVTLYHLHRGKKLILDVLRPGSIFGGFGGTGRKVSHYAEVTELAYVCIFNVEDFMKILQSRPQLMLRLLNILSEKMSSYEDRLKGQVFDAREKVLHQLRLLEKRKKINLLTRLMGKESRVTHEKLSQFTGLSRETVTRAMNDLKKEGKIIETADGLFTV